MLDHFDPQTVLSVSMLNECTQTLLESAFPWVRVRGEISNFCSAQSGHWYFSLKDPDAQIRCAFFRASAQNLPFFPKNGDLVEVAGKVSIYSERGDYQLIARQMTMAGDGDLARAFEALKKRLQAEGLFDAARKKPIPPFPEVIGVITSPSGAALQDILSTLGRRYPCAVVMLFPTLVQGAEAARSIIAALLEAQHSHCDVLILARGGGSLEDLWPFNDELLARVIAESRIPIISGIGHETDTTIADYVADLRAATPTAAAEHAVPDRMQLLAQIQGYKAYYDRMMAQYLAHMRLRVDHLRRRLIDPRQHLRGLRTQCTLQQQRLQQALRYILQQKTHALAACIQQLDAYNPAATLSRGYAIVRKDGMVVREASTLAVGDSITGQLGQGSFLATVSQVD